MIIFCSPPDRTSAAVRPSMAKSMLSRCGPASEVRARIEAALEKLDGFLQGGDMLGERRVRHARIADDLREHAGANQGARVFLRFDVQHVVLRGGDERRGQAREARGFERRRIRVHALGGLRQIRAVARCAFARGNVGRQAALVAQARHARVEHRPEQRLRGDVHVAAIARDEQMHSLLLNPKVSAQQKKEIFDAAQKEATPLRDEILKSRAAIAIKPTSNSWRHSRV